MTPSSLPKARRLGMMLALCLVVEAFAPAPALAWFGWLDEWSGPGPFWGVLYEARLLCFGPDSGIVKMAATYQEAQRSSGRVVAPSQPPATELRARVTTWQQALSKLLVAQISWKAFDPNQTRRVLRRIETIGEREVSITEFNDLVTDAENAFRQAIESRSSQVVTTAATGMFWSMCSDAKQRRVSIELNVDDWHGLKNENNNKFSGGTSIRMITVMPSVTWRPFLNKNADVVDVGVAAGYYAFSSRGFESVNGFIVEPVRIDLHAPPLWAAYPRTDVRRLAAMLTLRAGLKTIPSGFAADAFAPGSHPGDIGAEFVPTLGVFFNLNSLLGIPKTNTLPKTFP